MGIVYQFAMRFITVKDLDKVDLNVVTWDDDNFDEYLEIAKENRASKLKEVTMNPGSKSLYTVEDIEVPEGTQVITFGNDASDGLGGCEYKITFYYEDEKDDYDELVDADDERNRFMLIPKQCSSRLLFLDYSIGGEALIKIDRFFTEDDCRVRCFSLPGSDEEERANC